MWPCLGRETDDIVLEHMATADIIPFVHCLRQGLLLVMCEHNKYFFSIDACNEGPHAVQHVSVQKMQAFGRRLANLLDVALSED